jgi:branched-chain amino acid transport system ATP-binding protein
MEALMSSDHLLVAQNISKSYGSFVAMQGVDLNLANGEFVSVVGPNGAGKTTLVNVLTGLHSPTEGSVRFMGRDIAGLSPVDLSTRGLARAFQLVSVFPDHRRQALTVASCSRLGLRWKMFANASRYREVKEAVAATATAFRLTDSA